MPSILFINRVYPPADGATGEMLLDLAVSLHRSGWDVSVLTTASDGLPQRSILNGVRLFRLGTSLSRKNILLRACSYLSMIPSLLLHALRLPRTDFVVTMTDPPMLAVIGPLIAFFKKNKTIHWAQDIYPEVACELGVLTAQSRIFQILRGISVWALSQYDGVVSIGRCMTSRLLERGLEESKIHTIPNWSPPIAPLERANNPFRKVHGLEGEFVVMYSGNMGLAHDFDAVVDAAESLRGKHIVFLLIGNGPRRNEIERDVVKRSLDNVRFLPPQPRETLSQSLSAADAHIVTMRPNLSGLVVPSKFYGVLASGRPCLFVGPEDSEVARAIRDQNAGVVIDPGKPSDLAGAILDWAMDPVAHAAACRVARIAGTTATSATASAAFEEMLKSISSDRT